MSLPPLVGHSERRDPLVDFAESLMISVAMAADENRVGCDDGPLYEKWADKLHEAIDDGLEDAERRHHGVDPA